MCTQAIWLLTFKCTMMLDVKFGLITGIAFSALTVILRTQAPSSRLLERVNQTELYQDMHNAPGNVSAPLPYLLGLISLSCYLFPSASISARGPRQISNHTDDEH